MGRALEMQPRVDGCRAGLPGRRIGVSQPRRGTHPRAARYSR